MSNPNSETVKAEIPLPIQSALEAIAERLGQTSQILLVRALTEYIEREGVQLPNAEFVVETLNQHRSELEKLGVERLSLFGSVARGEESLGSDIDLIIDFFPKEKPDIFQLDDVKTKIQALLNTQARLGVVLGRSMEPQFKESIQAEVMKIY